MSENNAMYNKKGAKFLKNLLVVVDMQKDFVDGSLGTAEARAIVPNVIKKIEGWDGDIIATLDTHDGNYLNTREGRFLPVPHCIVSTDGHCIETGVFNALQHKNEHAVMFINKPTFGSTRLQQAAATNRYDYIELVGLCTDICVVNNAMLLKAALPESDISVDASCCAGVTPEAHDAALRTMASCQIVITNGSNN